MTIVMVSPHLASSTTGNHVTAQRWARILRSLGHRVHLCERYDDRPYDAMIALHARRNADAAARFHRLFPDRPLIVALTGTDLYHDLPRSAAARRSLEIATRLVLLQPEGIEELSPHLRGKARAIIQSAVAPRARKAVARNGEFAVAVLGHLRAVKDPLRAAMAARLLPKSSRIAVLHAGAALEPRYGTRARAEMARNARYRWLGELGHARAQRLLAASRLLVLTSRSEGGANVVSEALAAGVPIVGSNIGGTRGVLGAHYPGLYPPGDTRALAALLERAERDKDFYGDLRRRCRKLAQLVRPERELRAWRALIAEVAPHVGRLTES
ncbi:MAG: TIGR04348 family glycosyltransferase [bacterium]|nr:TIGR04348 family glycosyltransferase [bacterium]